MARLPTLRPEDVISALETLGFIMVRQTGSHVRLRHRDDRVVTVPFHRGQDLGRGLTRKILRDAKVTTDEFMAPLNI